VLLGSGLIGAVAIIPYALELSGDCLKAVPLPVLLVLQFAQNAIFLGVAVGLGLLLSRKVGLGAPVLEAWLYERRNLLTARMFAASAIAGAAIGAVIAVLVYFFFPVNSPAATRRRRNHSHMEAVPVLFLRRSG